jgi:acetyl esterase/lipase
LRKVISRTLIGAMILALLATAAIACFYKTFKPDRAIAYRQVNGVELSLDLFGIEHDGASPRPAILFFHGGAWSIGAPVQFYPWAQHFAELGWVAASAQYRLNGRHGTNAFDAVDDARAAYLYLQQHAAQWGIDPQRIVLAGGSAGGHLAAAVAMTPWPERATVPMSEALVLFNPALNTVYGDDQAIARLFAGKGKQVSPTHHVHPGLPPTFIVHGVEDSLVPISDSREFCARMTEAGNRCELSEYEGVGHGFYNWGGGHFDEVLSEVVKFTHAF